VGSAHTLRSSKNFAILGRMFKHPKLLVAVAMVAWVAAAVALAATDPWFFESAGDRLLHDARLARTRLDFGSASALLDSASAQDPSLVPSVTHERGLLARDRGDLEHALTLLAHAADLDFALPARVDAAGVMVQLGRWPEAIGVLRQAFDERGPSLAADGIAADPRFVKLAALKPYQDLIKTVRQEQAGPSARVVMRLERLQASVGNLELGFSRLGGRLVFIHDLVQLPWLGVLALWLLGMLVTFGLHQLGVFAPPWSVGCGMAVACGLWLWLAHALQLGIAAARQTVFTTGLVLLAAWALGGGVRWGWRRFAIARRGSHDPFILDNLADTLVLVDEVSRLGHRIVGERSREQRVLMEALHQAGDTLRERLDRGT
jgi:hypothetical protein